MGALIYKEESYLIIGKCFEVHNNLGPGFLEIVYKDALEYEFKQSNIPYRREKNMPTIIRTLSCLINFMPTSWFSTILFWKLKL